METREFSFRRRGCEADLQGSSVVGCGVSENCAGRVGCGVQASLTRPATWIFSNKGRGKNKASRSEEMERTYRAMKMKFLFFLQAAMTWRRFTQSIGRKSFVQLHTTAATHRYYEVGISGYDEDHILATAGNTRLAMGQPETRAKTTVTRIARIKESRIPGSQDSPAERDVLYGGWRCARWKGWRE